MSEVQALIIFIAKEKDSAAEIPMLFLFIYPVKFQSCTDKNKRSVVFLI